MRKIISTICILFFAVCVNAQQPIINVVSATGNNTFYSSLQVAINLAPAGSTIYVPGGDFQEDITISKKLTLIGVGHNPDSTLATGRTQIRSIVLNDGSSNSVIDGFFVTGDIAIYTVSYITIVRCNANRIVQYGVGNQISVLKTILRDNLYITGGGNGSSYFIKNCIIGYIAYEGVIANSTISNTIFLNNAYIYDNNNVAVSCIFMNGQGGIGYAGTNNYQSNIFNNATGAEGCINGQNGANNIFDQTSQQTFVNQTGTTFSYYNDYHLKATSPGKLAGQDGKDIGIYGGTTPWVDGNLPPNPHIRNKEVGQTTGSDGKLPVKFTITLPKP